MQRPALWAARRLRAEEVPPPQAREGPRPWMGLPACGRLAHGRARSTPATPRRRVAAGVVADKAARIEDFPQIYEEHVTKRFMKVSATFVTVSK